jgi:hypothetical protein
MPSFNVQAQIAFKNLLGKSQTNDTLQVLNEKLGYFLNVPSSNVWSSKITPNDPTQTIANGFAVFVRAELVEINTSFNSSRYKAYQAVWSSIPPAGKDPKTNLDFAFGSGSLKDVKAEDNIYDFISSSYGFRFEVAPFINSVEISQGDDRDWVFQYSSGVFYQSSVTHAGYTAPTNIEGYFYIGNKLSALDPTGPDVVRVSATGPVDTVYYATTSVPFISTYSTSNLFLVDFAFGNTTSVKLNVNYLGTHSVYKFGPGGLGELASGDIVGATGGTSGPVYYLNWDSDGYFIFNTSNPSQTPGGYSNPNLISNTLGGIDQGYSFNAVQLQDMFTDLLYPEQLGNISSFDITGTTQGNITLVDLGRPITGVLTFSWGLSMSTGLTGPLKIDDVTTVGPNGPNWPVKSTLATTYSISNSPIGYTYPSPLYSNTQRTRDYLLSLPRLNGTTIAKYNHVTWTYRAYYGSSTYTTLTPTQVTGLSSSLMTQSLGSYTILGTQGYKYMAFPDVTGYNFNNVTTFGLPLVLAGSSDGYASSDNGNNYTTSSVTNNYGIISTYRIYRTKNQITGTLSVNITN